MSNDPHYRTVVIYYNDPADVPDINIYGELLGGECTAAAVGDLMSELDEAQALLNEIDPYVITEAQLRLEENE